MARDGVWWEMRRTRTVVVSSVGDGVSADTWEAARVVSGTSPVATDGDVDDDWESEQGDRLSNPG